MFEDLTWGNSEHDLLKVYLKKKSLHEYIGYEPQTSRSMTLHFIDCTVFRCVFHAFCVCFGLCFSFFLFGFQKVPGINYKDTYYTNFNNDENNKLFLLFMAHHHNIN